MRDIIAASAATIVFFFFIVIGIMDDTMQGLFLAVGIFAALFSMIYVHYFLSKRQRKRELKRQQEANQNYQSALNIVKSNVDSHLKTLARKHRSFVRSGDYGETVDDGWNKEIRTFLKATTPGKVYCLMALDENEAMPALVELVNEAVKRSLDSSFELLDEDDISQSSGIDYEVYCEERLRLNGWSVKRTPPTGDHGVDLIAEKIGRKIVIQCKRYGSPVGNKAVQEVYSGMGFYDSGEAVVVSNAPFTEAAKQAANKLSVTLMHHSQLVEL